jgi:hypothetical protein
MTFIDLATGLTLATVTGHFIESPLLGVNDTSPLILGVTTGLLAAGSGQPN